MKKLMIILLLFGCAESEDVIIDQSEACQRLESDSYTEPRDEFRSIYYTSTDDYIFVGCYSPYQIEVCRDKIACENTMGDCFDAPLGYSITVVKSSVSTQNYTITNQCG
jgi:hypothetical protein